MRFLTGWCVLVLLLCCCGVPAAATPLATATAADEVGKAEPDRSRLEAEVVAAGAVVSALTARVAAARSGTAAPWQWPLPGQRVVREFDPPASRWGAGHRGIDILGAVGTHVSAVDEGVVSYSGVIAGMGVVSVQHDNGLRSTYQPVEDRVARGSRVGRGEPIGTLAAGGHCLLVTCLHLGALRGRDHYVDPLGLLRGWRLALLRLD